MMKHALVFGCAVSLSEISPSGECEVKRIVVLLIMTEFGLSLMRCDGSKGGVCSPARCLHNALAH